MKSKKPLPLKGQRILVGRARHQASKLSSELRSLGATVMEIPFIEIRKPRSYRLLDDALRNLKEYDWLILTSVNGVDAVWQRMKALRIPVQGLRRLDVAAIGPATRGKIEAHGVHVAVMPDEYVAEAVVKSLRRRARGKRVLLARARVARDVIPRELRKIGARVDVVEAYETVTPKSSRVRLQTLFRDPRRAPTIITFTSSSTVKNFRALLGARGVKQLQQAKLASIGPVTSATLKDLGLPVHIKAKEYTIPGLVRAIVGAF